VVKAGDAFGGRELHVGTIRRHKRQILVRFDEIGTAEAQTLIGADLYIERGDVALKEDEYFDDDLLGCAVVDGAGADLGKVVEVLHYPAQDVLAVGARRVLIPLVGAFIRCVDLERKRIDVELPEGLVD